MELDEKAEETLETLWVHSEKKGEDSISLEALDEAEKESIEGLRQAGYISVADDRVSLTSKGQPEARNVVRRHRLAERLLADVLDTKGSLVYEKACKFEHLLDRGLDESICILLGHPKVCPHGKPIPPGRCCQEEQTPPQKLVSPLSQLAQGQRGKVVYIYAPELSRLQKLMAMGILPGASISLIQSFPSYVFQSGQTQFAIDKEIADAIYVRLTAEEVGETRKKPPPRHRWQWGRITKGFGFRRTSRG